MEEEKTITMKLTEKEATDVHRDRLWKNRDNFISMLPGIALFFLGMILLLADVITDVVAAIITVISFILFLWRSKNYQKKILAEAKAVLEKEKENNG